MVAKDISEFDWMVAHTAPWKMYDPNVPVVKWRHNMCLITVVVCNSLSFLILVARLAAQRKRFGRFRKADVWTICITIMLVFPFWTSQMMMITNGSGYHIKNIKMHWRITHWRWAIGWASFYILEAMVKISLCVSFLPMIPDIFRSFRIMLYVICFISISLSIAVMLVWFFQCRPFMSNFSFKSKVQWCLNIDAARYTWAAVSIVIDLALVYTPIVMVRQVHLSKREVKVLYVVFCGNLLGTVATGASCYGIWVNRMSEANRDLGWTEAIYIMCNSIEILFYVVGSSLIAFSHHFLGSRAANGRKQPRVGMGQVRELNLSIFDRVPSRRDKTRQRDEEGEVIEDETTLQGPGTGFSVSDPKLPKLDVSICRGSDAEVMEMHQWSHGSSSSRNCSIPIGSQLGSMQTLVGLERYKSGSAVSTMTRTDSARRD